MISYLQMIRAALPLPLELGTNNAALIPNPLVMNMTYEYSLHPSLLIIEFLLLLSDHGLPTLSIV